MGEAAGKWYGLSRGGALQRWSDPSAVLALMRELRTASPDQLQGRRALRTWQESGAPAQHLPPGEPRRTGAPSPPVKWGIEMPLQLPQSWLGGCQFILKSCEIDLLVSHMTDLSFRFLILTGAS